MTLTSDSYKKSLKSLAVSDFPLKDCCQHSGDIEENSIDISILSSVEIEHGVQLKIGVFFREILAGCACSDDPSEAISYENGYCELQVNIDKTTEKITFF
ncbi:hypothetical protein SPBRAN_2037 [uncultured Candidatus Thioglobus sp.]|nr:hypothetical protein SPBRAN_2037 [uncultured Candidatus Thioglobus sp.]